MDLLLLFHAPPRHDASGNKYNCAPEKKGQYICIHNNSLPLGWGREGESPSLPNKKFIPLARLRATLLHGGCWKAKGRFSKRKYHQ